MAVPDRCHSLWQARSPSMTAGAIQRRRRRSATYASGTVRAWRWHGDGDVRGYRPPRGWTAVAELTDIHPISGQQLTRSVWWIIETKQ